MGKRLYVPTRSLYDWRRLLANPIKHLEAGLFGAGAGRVLGGGGRLAGGGCGGIAFIA